MAGMLPYCTLACYKSIPKEKEYNIDVGEFYRKEFLPTDVMRNIYGLFIDVFIIFV